MPDYIYTIKPEFPITERISFLTDIVEFDALLHVAVGSPAQFNTYTYNGVLMPAPQFPVQETTNRESLVSDLQDKKFEQRRVRYETNIKSYNLNFELITYGEKETLVNFFTARKGKYDNFNVQYPTMFDGANTLVRFATDTLEVQLVNHRIYTASIEVRQAVNGQYSIKNAGARREFVFPYLDSSLTTLKTWLKDTAAGRSASFTLDLSQILNYLSGAYTCRLKSDDFLESYNGINEKTIEVELIETV